MGVFPVSMSLLASFMSAITLLGTPAEIYTYGTLYCWIAVSYIFTMIISSQIYIPIFYNMQLTSVFEYLEQRFNHVLRMIGSAFYIVQMTLYLAIVLYAPCFALTAVTGINLWIGILCVGVVCIFYTTLGGLKAVMWTDTFQVFLMFIGLIAIIIQGCLDHGATNLFLYMEEGQRIEYVNFDPDPTVRHTFWGLTIGATFMWTAIYGVNQAQVQRALSVETLKKAQVSYLLNILGLIALLFTCSACGFVVYAEYKDCDPLTTQRISGKDQLLALYVMDILGKYKGIPGLFVASIFSGSLSSLSSGINSLAAITMEDFIQRYFFKEKSDAWATKISKLLAFIYGVMILLLTYPASQLGGVLQAALSLFGMIGGPILGLFTLGIFIPFANTKGAFIGFFSGLFVILWVGFGQFIFPANIHKAPISVEGCSNFTIDNSTVGNYNEKSGDLIIYELSYLWFTCLAVMVVLIVGVIVSAMTGGCKEKVSPSLLFKFNKKRDEYTL